MRKNQGYALASAHHGLSVDLHLVNGPVQAVYSPSLHNLEVFCLGGWKDDVRDGMLTGTLGHRF